MESYGNDWTLGNVNGDTVVLQNANLNAAITVTITKYKEGDEALEFHWEADGVRIMEIWVKGAAQYNDSDYTPAGALSGDAASPENFGISHIIFLYEADDDDGDDENGDDDDGDDDNGDDDDEKDVDPEEPETDPEDDDEDDLPVTVAMSVLPLGLTLLVAGGLLLKKKE